MEGFRVAEGGLMEAFIAENPCNLPGVGGCKGSFISCYIFLKTNQKKQWKSLHCKACHD